MSVLKRLQFISQVLTPRHIALSDAAVDVTYDQLIHRVKNVALWLKGHGAQVVALHGFNGIDWVVIDLACQELGVVCVPLPTFFSGDQIRGCLRQAGVDFVLSHQPDAGEGIFSDLGPEALEQCGSFHAWRIPNPAVSRLPEGTQKITFTSGSTGQPKGVCLSTEQQWRVAQSLADAVEIQCPRHVCLLPLSTLLENIAGVYSPLLSGGHIVLPSDQTRGMSGSSGLDTRAFLACLDEIQPQTMILIPQLLSVLVAARRSGWHPPGSLQFVAVGGGKVSPYLIALAHDCGLPVYQGYGLSECGSVVALNTPEQSQLESVGKVLPHCEVTIEDGEIVVSGAVHLGYLGDEAHWYPEKIHTGDIGSLNGDYLSISGRKKNLLISSFGRNINPEWVESELMSRPCLSQCMVFGDGQPFLSALVCAPAQIRDEGIEHFIGKVNKRLPDYARVHRLLRVDESDLTPCTTANGRLRRDQVAEQFFEAIQAIYSSSTVSGEPLERMNQ